MLPPERRLTGIPPLLEEKAYFVVHAPRQSGKTTSFQALAKTLTAQGSYAALLASCETGRTAAGPWRRGSPRARSSGGQAVAGVSVVERSEESL